ncbi:succinyl-diaminopimelate desuccinylase [Pseudoroseomonas rhizosphaerae]|uniref:Succinyl-diaminopimelate desuccinylase n=1 Tax=Teichococcus rhizosphaerae TaxID=1335062 RepID=A0A2C7AA06_9PROT|nr:succinyl-diaminopimelate desuccinylase [Pseudoroseomonas rhizosphaerae]PHK96948.1 succinyl-diaminopimelate desuccinylase [Pseudoroseomonas rhizosphaerae]
MDPLPLLQDLICCPSVTPAEGGALRVLEAVLTPLGFTCTRLRFGPKEGEEGEAVENLFARRGTGAPHLCFAGHTDVVPPGDPALWTADPFGAELRGGLVMGRGATDMKGGIAAWIAAIASLPRDLPGSLSLLITGDEEGPATYGTVKVLEWMAAHGHTPDMCLVGEPTSRAVLGDTIKIGRRGSMNAAITVQGVQGHSAYPQRADNPVHRLVRVLHRLTARPLDEGSAWFEPSTLQVTSVDVGNPATNVIPGTAQARLNIRFNDHHSSASLTALLHAALRAEEARYRLEVSCSGESFLTKPGPFVAALAAAVRREAGVEPKLDTGGGTSDARFVAHYCPVAELGAVGTTMHKADESTPVEELRRLSRLYAAVIRAQLGLEPAA